MKIDERLFRKFGRVFLRGTYIFREGDSSREMYYILSGRVHVLKRTGQVTKVLAEMGPGQVFGEMAALISDTRTASARAAEDSHIAVIDGNTFADLLRESGDVSVLMLKEFAYRIKNTNLALEEVAQSRIKLVAALYFLKEWPLDPHTDPVRDLAEYTGKEPEEIAKVLEDMAASGVITLDHGRVADFHKERAWALMHVQ
jgi:CRP-like cAMP-binding protein